MAIMTEEEADALDELLTRTTPAVNPAVKGITARKGVQDDGGRRFFRRVYYRKSPCHAANPGRGYSRAGTS